MADLGTGAIIVRLVVAALLGAAIGFEREMTQKDAGLRTHLMLALGAGVFGVLSVGAFDTFADQRGDTNFQVDVTRVASYVAAGIGFICGGVIFTQGDRVKVLTTGTTLWVAAAVGLAAGLGFWVPAVTATAISLIALVVLRPLVHAIDRIVRPPDQKPRSD